MTFPVFNTLANDAHLVQLVRGSLGRDSKARDLPRPNVSSCKLVITLHGSVRSLEERRYLEEVAWRMPGVRRVKNKIKVAPRP